MVDYWIFGLPVIASRLHATADVHDESVIEYYEPGDPVDLARAIKHLHDDPPPPPAAPSAPRVEGGPSSTRAGSCSRSASSRSTTRCWAAAGGRTAPSALPVRLEVVPDERPGGVRRRAGEGADQRAAVAPGVPRPRLVADAVRIGPREEGVDVRRAAR